MTTLFLPCAGGVEPLLADEVLRITGQRAEAGRGGVWVEGDERSAMALNLESRLAQRVLWPLIDGRYRDEHDLYDLARRVAWGDWITPRQTLRVDVTAGRGRFGSPLKSLNFTTLRIKDAVCDVIRDATGERPSVATHRPDLAIALFVGPEHATLYVDTSGEALFKRGWREVQGEAPLKETLAAAMLAAAGWQGREQDGPLLDPVCGAGTIAIEAAQLACGIAPGSQRRFAFETLLPFRAHQAAWRELQQAARERVHAPRVQVFAGDVSFRMTDFAKRNAERAGVARAIEFKTADALQRMPPVPRGTLMLNPPYGERIAAKGKGSDTAREGFEGGGSSAEFFAGLASHWKRHYAGWTAWVLSPDMKLPSLMRLKENRRVPMWNGPIECRLFRFEMIAGSNKEA
ncbi:MAG: RNA methyltransferase [Rubrivivax sp. SCN 70-15]|nr:MAG: RNA methyltransferase [Rubrivivax sp. SCN 70-15]